MPTIHDQARKVELSSANLNDAYLPFSVASEREAFFSYPHIDVAVYEGEISGFCAYDENEMSWLYVSPKRFRLGIGKALVHHALLNEPNIKNIEVLVATKLLSICTDLLAFRSLEF